MIKNQNNLSNKEIVCLSTFVFFLIFLTNLVIAVSSPVPPDSMTIWSNDTKNVSSTSSFMLNTSGGVISKINFTSSTQNPHWKAFVGYITGKFTLDDSNGSTIYDWTLATVSGVVFATRDSTAILWPEISCANVTTLRAEDNALSQTNQYDNITKTFNANSATGNHSEFFVGSVNISINSCPTVHTYVNDSSQTSRFAEVALYTSGTIVYSTLLENRVTGFDYNPYDFQMLVPENGAKGFSGATAYYLYVELT
jgi:hypothetical protein